MKKWLIAVAALFIILVISIYIFIPSKLIVSKVTVIACTRDAANRILSDKNTWGKWWPVNDAASPLAAEDGAFVYKKFDYTLSKILYTGVGVTIGHGHDHINSTIEIIPIRKDSLAAQWQCEIRASRNPLKRILQYSEAIDIKNNMAVLLDSLRAFLEVERNIYGINIIETSTTDTLLMATRSVLPSYPSNADIYHLAGLIKQYINSAQAKVTGSPLVNITPLPKGQFELMVAVPTNKELKGNGAIFYREMIPGNFLMAEVKGGDSAIAQARKQMHYFMEDHQKVSMAIPFAIFITDRMAETDTGKWVTRLYEPIFK